MSFTRFQRNVIAAWFVITTALIVGRLSMTLPLSLADAVGLLVACVPAVVFMVVFTGPQQTIAQVLYETEHVGPGGTRLAAAPARTR
jgi:hypothetical protein